jgi:hypothetical protein
MNRQLEFNFEEINNEEKINLISIVNKYLFRPFTSEIKQQMEKEIKENLNFFCEVMPGEDNNVIIKNIRRNK